MHHQIENLLKSGKLRKILMAVTAACALIWSVLWLTGLVPPQSGSANVSAGQDDPANDQGPGTVGTTGKGKPLTEAERIGMLTRALEDDKKELTRITSRLKDPASSYRKVETWFKNLDEQLANKQKEVQQAKDANKTKELPALEASLKEVAATWQRARDAFNLAIEERKTLVDQSTVLQQKILGEKKALDNLTGAMEGDGVPPAAHTDKGNGSMPAGQQAVVPPAVEPLPPLSGKVSSAPPAPVAVKPGANPQPSATPAKGGTAATGTEKPESKELRKALQEANAKEAAARKAKDRVDSIKERLANTRKNIELEQRLLEIARQKADRAHESVTRFEKELKRMTVEDPAGVPQQMEKIAAAQQRLAEARADVRSSTDRLNELQSDLSVLQNKRITALSDAAKTEKAAKKAEATVASLQNPFTLVNVLKWLIQHGPRLLALLVVMVMLHQIVKLSSRRIVKIMSRGNKRGSVEERENRAHTLVGVFRNVASMVILGGGSVMALDEVGVPVVPLMGGAAVLGLAVAFGAQNLIRDYFCGFMVLLENQYGINDVVKIGDISGLVEGITLRMTVLRDIEGVVHFVPHGTITTVSNMTHGFSRAFFSIGIAYKEDVDRVMSVLVDLGKELRQHPEFGPRILEDPEMLGVDSFDDSAVVLKFFMKTRPLQQWTVRRELLKRIKQKFDELKIEIPFPHRTVYHRYETEAPADGMRPECRSGAERAA